MRLSDESIEYFITTLQELHKNEKLFEMHQYIQHGNTSTYLHCLAVAYTSYKMSFRFKSSPDRKNIIRGAMLHDFYLYDWHIPHESHRLHGFYHPRFALANAKKHYSLSPIEEDIIRTHMWPLTLTLCPKYKESALVCLVDKICSLSETFHITLKSKEFQQIVVALIKTI